MNKAFLFLIGVLQLVAFAQTLPIIRIDTDDGKEITSKVDWATMTFELTDSENPQNNIPSISNQQIRGRGNSSWNASWNVINPPDGINTYRNPYRIRFRSNQQQSLFGLPAARNWALINADPDKNAFGFEMGQQLDLQYTCSYNFVKVYVNNGNSGNYILTEHRQADPAYIGAPGRPKVHLTEGWFVEMDRYFPEDEPVKFRTDSNAYNLPVIIKSPEFSENANDPRYDFVKNDLLNIERLMFSNDFPENGYRNLVDAETFIKYFLVQTFVQNVDIFRKGTETGEHIGSAFFYKDKGGKISAGPIWDLNWSFQEFYGADVTRYGNMGPTYYPYMVHPWLSRFFDDPEFLVRYKEIWNEYLPKIESMRGLIAGMAEKTHGTSAWTTSRINSMTNFYDRRLTFLKEEYSKVNVRPTVRDFGIASRDYSEARARDVTFVSYGSMSGLSATLYKGALSDFEIISNPTSTPTGKGGYLAAVSVKPKESLSPGEYSDTLLLSATKQGQNYSFKVPLNFVVSPDIITPIMVSSKLLVVSGTQKIEVYNMRGERIFNGQWTMNNGQWKIPIQTKGVYIVKIGNQTQRIVVR